MTFSKGLTHKRHDYWWGKPYGTRFRTRQEKLARNMWFRVTDRCGSFWTKHMGVSVKRK